MVRTNTTAAGTNPPPAKLLAGELPNLVVVTSNDVAKFLGGSRKKARGLLCELEANYGLRRKGRGPGTHYTRAEFLAAYEAMDTRP